MCYDNKVVDLLLTPWGRRAPMDRSNLSETLLGLINGEGVQYLFEVFDCLYLPGSVRLAGE